MRLESRSGSKYLKWKCNFQRRNKEISWKTVNGKLDSMDNRVIGSELHSREPGGSGIGVEPDLEVFTD